jgi:ribosomal protein RSM22 (predicted rRNA methylase)
MPATFAAIAAVCRAVGNLPVRRLLDIGAGPGTGAWAAAEWFESLTEVVCIEKDPLMAQVGMELFSHSPLLSEAQWRIADFQRAPLPEADMALLSYAIGEVATGEEIVDRAADAASIVAVIEPGTPAGYERILRCRELLLKKGRFLIAPCPHQKGCPLADGGGKWCHFPARVERTRLHRQLKQGTLGFEDEKFSYVVASKYPPSRLPDGRIIDRPHIGSGMIVHTVCASGGAVEQWRATRSDKQAFRDYKDRKWGDPIVPLV